MEELSFKIEKSGMKVAKIWAYFFYAFLFSYPFLGFSDQQGEELKIFQTDKKIVVDGNLEEWSEIEEFLVDLTPVGERIEPSPSMMVKAKFTYDSERFYAAVLAKDDMFEFPSRSWRYGDGLYLTFLDPYQGNESDRFITFGFSIEEQKLTKVIVNKDAVYFPRIDIRDVELKIVPDVQKGEIIYEIAIPWRYLIPSKPFIQEKWGINLIYVDRDQGKRRMALLYPDTGYDTELSTKRKGALFRFVSHTPKDYEIQMSLDASHFFDESQKRITCAINSPMEKTGWKIRYELSSAYGNVSSVDEIGLKSGMNTFRFNLGEMDYSSGLYDFSLGVIDEKGTLRFTDNTRFFVLNRKEFENFQRKIAEIKSGDLYAKDTRFRESFPTMEIRIDWIKDFMEKAHPFAEIEPIKEWFEEIEALFKNIDEGKPTLFPLGTIGRLAHRSEIDGTLQPYSVYVPEDYDEKTPVPLFVTLHGSGVDERDMISNVARIYTRARLMRKAEKMIVIAPKGRGLSDWYLGDSGEDVIECINHIRNLYNIDERNIILDGFSMGGYGAWRLSLLHPDIFKAVIIHSGAIAPLPSIKGENILDLLDRGRNLNFFIIHGDRDDAVSVENARRAVEKLKELQIKHKYVEVKGAAHGNYNKWNEIFDWLRFVMR